MRLWGVLQAGDGANDGDDDGPSILHLLDNFLTAAGCQGSRDDFLEKIEMLSSAQLFLKKTLELKGARFYLYPFCRRLTSTRTSALWAISPRPLRIKLPLPYSRAN